MQSTDAGRPQALRSTPCSTQPPVHSGLSAAASPELRRLAQYEAVCGGAVAARSSFFAPTPADEAEADAYGADMAAELKEYARFGISPLVIMEPDGGDDPLDFRQYEGGAYDAALNRYFAYLKASGITDQMMGIWAVFPEANIPVWGNVDPNLFAANVSKTVGIQKKYFPSSQATILLDGETYPAGGSWSDGTYISLLPYIQAIPKGLIDSFGLQGFPWMPPKGEPGAVLDPKAYLPIDLAAQAARALGVQSVWLNTGTFSRTHTQTADQTVPTSAAQRQLMLDGVVAQARALQRQGFTTSVHLFAEDKSAAEEGIDWSYWHEASDAGEHTAVFKTFVRDLRAAGIPLWIFDAAGS